MPRVANTTKGRDNSARDAAIMEILAEFPHAPTRKICLRYRERTGRGVDHTTVNILIGRKAGRFKTTVRKSDEVEAWLHDQPDSPLDCPVFPRRINP